MGCTVFLETRGHVRGCWQTLALAEVLVAIAFEQYMYVHAGCRAPIARHAQHVACVARASMAMAVVVTSFTVNMDSAAFLLSGVSSIFVVPAVLPPEKFTMLRGSDG